MSPRLSDLLLGAQSDARLVALARAGHDRAFTVIVERYRRPLVDFARRLDADRAEDLVQQTLLSAFAALRSGSEVRHLRGWLYRILRNAASRPPGSVPTVISARGLEDVVVESADQTAERRMLATEVLAELSRLPGRQQDALIGVALHGRSRAELAEGMGVTEGSVRQLVHRARASVRAAVTAITPFPLVRWCTGPGPSSAGAADPVGLGVGVTSSGALILKAGAIVASGLVAAGVVAGTDGHRQAPRTPARSGAPVITRSGGGEAAVAGRTGVPGSAAVLASDLMLAGRRGGEHAGERVDSRGRDSVRESGGSESTSGGDGGSGTNATSTDGHDGVLTASAGGGGSDGGGTSGSDGGTSTSGTDGATASQTTTSASDGGGSGGGSDGGSSGSTGGSSDSTTTVSTTSTVAASATETTTATQTTTTTSSSSGGH